MPDVRGATIGCWYGIPGMPGGGIMPWGGIPVRFAPQVEQNGEPSAKTVPQVGQFIEIPL